MTDQALDVEQSVPASTEPVASAADTSKSINNSENNSTTTTTPTETSVKTEINKPQTTSSILPKESSVDEWKQISGNKYETPNDLAKAYKELSTKFSKTRPLPQLPKDATPEQIKEYRQASGIPESWEKYDLNLDKGLIIGDADKPIINEYLKGFHEANLKSDDVKKVLQIHFEKQTQLAADSIKKAEEHQKQTEASLRDQLGSKYDERVAMASSYIKSSLGEDVFNKLMASIAPDGTYLINDPKVLNHFLEVSKNEYGNSTPVPVKGVEMTGMLSRKAELEKLSRDNPKQWYDNAELRGEYNDIINTLAKR